MGAKIKSFDIFYRGKRKRKINKWTTKSVLG